MYRRFHERFGTAGLVVAVIALIAALAGTAIAAAGLTAVQKKQVIKIAKKYAGQDGAPGAAGSVGPQGPKGDTGAKGETGDTGEAGMCSEENAECVLASGATSTGAWSAVADEASGITLATISFPVRVIPAPIALYAFTTPEGTVGLELKDGSVGGYGFNFPPAPGELEAAAEDFAEACPGSFDEPEAAPGILCLYRGASEGEIFGPNFFSTNTEAANDFGIHVPLRFVSAASGTSSATLRGSWAVTG